MTQFFVYTHARPDGTVFYVGKGCNGRERDFFGRSEYHKRIVAKHGRENILVRSYAVHDERHALECERQLIAALRRAGIELCNMLAGGETGGNRIFSDAHRERIRQSRLGKRHTPEALAKISAASKSRAVKAETRAKLAAWKRSPEHLEALVAGRRGKPHTAETKEAISAANRGKKRTPEQLQRQSDAHQGFKPKPEDVAKRAASLRATNARKRAHAAGAD